MADQKNHQAGEPDAPPEHRDVRYERGDLRARWLLALLVGIGCVFAIIGFAMWRFLWVQEAGREEAGRTPYALPAAPPGQLPPEPRLEQLDRMAKNNYADVARQLSAKERVLNSYGPTEEKGFVHIPIQQAIRVLAGEARAGKLPQRRPAPPGKDRGLRDAGASNSGRVFTGAEP